MKLQVLTSGSRGNATKVESGKTMFLIDCGKSYNWLIQRLEYRLPKSVWLTHEHRDHAYGAKQFLKRGVEVYMTAGTAQELGLTRALTLRIIKAGQDYKVGQVTIQVLPSIHDAAEPCNFILSDERDRVLYVTDTHAPPQVQGQFTQIFIEANFAEQVLLESEIGYPHKMRILQNHLSIEQVVQFLRHYPKAQKTLLHISKRHGDEAKFYELLRNDEVQR